MARRLSRDSRLSRRDEGQRTNWYLPIEGQQTKYMSGRVGKTLLGPKLLTLLTLSSNNLRRSSRVMSIVIRLLPFTSLTPPELDDGGP